MNITINNINIYYEKEGTGKNKILILPGWGNTRETFKSMINYLKKENTVYILDYPGFGKSNFPKRNLTIYDYAQLIKSFLEKEKITEPIIIAHSFGSRIALILNAKYNIKINKLIIIDGAGIKPKKNIYRIIKTFAYKTLKKISKILPKKKKEKYLGKLISIFGSRDYKSLTENMRKTFSHIVNEDLSYLLKSVSVETLLIWGELDKDTPVKDAYKMNKYIKDSGLVIIKKGTHFSYLDAPFYINKIITTFISTKD